MRFLQAQAYLSVPRAFPPDAPPVRNTTNAALLGHRRHTVLYFLNFLHPSARKLTSTCMMQPSLFLNWNLRAPPRVFLSFGRNTILPATLYLRPFTLTDQHACIQTISNANHIQKPLANTLHNLLEDGWKERGRKRKERSVSPVRVAADTRCIRCDHGWGVIFLLRAKDQDVSFN